MVSDVERKLISLLDGLLSRLPDTDIKHVRELIDAGECDMALEDLCTQLYERDVRITELEFNDIRLIGSDLKVDPKEYVCLSSLVTKSSPK